MSNSNSTSSLTLNPGDGESEPLIREAREATSLQYGGRSTASTVIASDAETEDRVAVLTKAQAWSLYLSHFLSTWNARGYEFAAIILTASAYPETLTASSIRGILTTIAVLTLSTLIGHWCDKHPSRLRALQITIFMQRISVVLACFGWIFIVQDEFLRGGFWAVVRGDRQQIATERSATFSKHSWAKAAVMTGVIVLGIFERLSAVGNMMVMERDWVPTLATSTSKPSLSELNAVMRRIDLLCKLVAPVFISVIAIWAASVRVVIFVIAGMNLTSVGIEWFAAKSVWMKCGILQIPKPIPGPDEVGFGHTEPRWERWSRGSRLFFGSEIWIPSLALALLYFSALSFSASMITYLLNAGFTLSVITIARTGSTFIEISSTVVMPWGVKIMEKAAVWKARAAHGANHTAPEPAAAVERMGLWGLWWMVVNLAPVTVILFDLPTNNTTNPTPALTISLFVFLALSRLGLWTYDLVAQTLVQTRIPTTHRGEFSGVEMGFISAAELAQWVATAILNSPGQFKFLAAAGNVSVMVSALAYTAWMWRRRGHLLHWEKVGTCTGCR